VQGIFEPSDDKTHTMWKPLPVQGIFEPSDDKTQPTKHNLEGADAVEEEDEEVAETEEGGVPLGADRLRAKPLLEMVLALALLKWKLSTPWILTRFPPPTLTTTRLLLPFTVHRRNCIPPFLRPSVARPDS